MIRHALKFMWNQKRKNLYLILELFLIFTVILLSGTYFIEKIALYIATTCKSAIEMKTGKTTPN